MSITVRKMFRDDARAFLEVHHAAVRGTAAKDYPLEIIEDWAPLPVTDKSIEAFLANPDEEIRLVAEVDGRIVGVGCLVVAKSELRACYVLPEASRAGVGAALVGEIERIARSHGLHSLQADSSISASSFYARLGYTLRGRSDHLMRSGRRMACVKIEKAL